MPDLCITDMRCWERPGTSGAALLLALVIAHVFSRHARRQLLQWAIQMQACHPGRHTALTLRALGQQTLAQVFPTVRVPGTDRHTGS